MKSATLIAIATVASALVLGSLGTAEAGGHHSSYSSSYSGGYGHHHCDTPSYGQSYQGYGQGYQQNCQPYRVSSCEINRCQQCLTAYDNCGHPYMYHVTVVTYRDTYSDGSCQTYTRTFS